jgi:hypothetical protein
MVTMALTKIQQREAADLNQRLLELVDDYFFQNSPRNDGNRPFAVLRTTRIVGE